MPMIWFRVCAEGGPQCEKVFPNPDFQWAHLYGSESTPKIMGVDDLSELKKHHGHGTVLANIWVDDEEFYYTWIWWPRINKKYDELKDNIMNLANEIR